MRAPTAGVVYIGDRAVSIPGERFTRIGGLGPPPHTITFVAADRRLTVVDIPADTIDLTSLLGLPDGLPGNPVALPVRTTTEGSYDLVGIVGEQIIRGTGDRIILPSDQPTDLWAVWRRDGRAIGMAYRRLNRPGVWTEGIELEPTIALDGQIDVQVPRAPSGWVRAELTIDGLRTGLILGDGLAGPDSAVRIRRPTADEVPGAGLWLSARADDLEQAVHVALETDAAGLEWPEDPRISPRPGDIDAGTVITRDRPRLRWTPAPGLLRAELTATDGCSTEQWQLIADAETGILDLPLPPGGDPLALPLLTGSVRIDSVGETSFAARVEGGLGPAYTLPQHTNQVQVRGTTGAWRAGLSSCTPVDLQGTWHLVPTDRCDDSTPAQRVIVDRCGAFVPIPADPAVCGAVIGRALVLRGGGRFDLSPDGDGWRVGDAWQLRPPLAPVTDSPPELRGVWFQVTASEQAYEPGLGGGPGLARSSEAVLEVGDPAMGPWAMFDHAGRLTIRLPDHPLNAVLLGFDGASARLAIDGRACADAPTATARAEDGQLVIEEWVPGDGILRRWRLARR